MPAKCNHYPNVLTYANCDHSLLTLIPIQQIVNTFHFILMHKHVYINNSFIFFQIYQGLLDKWTPYTRVRWVAAGVLLLLFFLRIFLCQGWYIVCYALEIYHLNLFIAFLTPKIDPEFDLYGEWWPCIFFDDFL